MDMKLVEQRELLGKDFRIYGSFEEPKFLAKDVAEWIEHSDSSKMLQSIDENEKLIRTLFVSGQKREVWLLTEDGLYEVLMQSRKPMAKEFKKQVKEILKSVRKHGMYAKDELLDNPDFLADVVNKLRSERTLRLAAQAQVEADKPKVVFANAVSASKDTILIRHLAKFLKQNGIDVGQNRLFEQLRGKGYLIKNKGADYNMPTQRSMDMGLFELKETAIARSDGSVTISTTPKVTGKGQQYFINVFLSENVKELAK